MGRANGALDPAAVARAFERTRQALDEVAKEVGPSGQLAGEAFGVADLACASLLAVLVDPPHPDMAWPRPLPERLEAFLARWAPHPGAQWVMVQYGRHRPPPCAVG
jgi:glutathione S-transferase